MELHHQPAAPRSFVALIVRSILTWGSGLAAIVLVGASMIFAWYVEKFDSYERIYGSLGAAVGFMTWIWLSVVVVLLGAKLDVAIDRKGR